MATSLSAARADALRAAPLTYAEVGATRSGAPVGYRYFEKSRRVHGSAGIDELAVALLGWQVQTRAGLRVSASADRAAPGVVVELRVGVGPLCVVAPCRVVYVVDEPDRRGFAYGTLPGHPETGEESFVLHRAPGGGATLVVTAFSRPDSPLARLGGPVTAAVQSLITRRYLRSLDS